MTVKDSAGKGNDNVRGASSVSTGSLTVKGSPTTVKSGLGTVDGSSPVFPTNTTPSPSKAPAGITNVMPLSVTTTPPCSATISSSA